MNKVPMTINGSNLLKDELKNLKSIERPKITQAIREAREKGDLKENAEYHAAREQQSFIEGRIKDIEAKLSNAQVIDIKSIPQSSKVIFGSTVIIKKTDVNKNITYTLVGEDEADIKKNKISITSPMARSLVGKDEGDCVEIKTPDGTTEYEIVEVKYV